MTDNRTAELRKLLDERSIEYAELQDRFRTRFCFNYCEACGDYLNEIEVMGACITASKSYLMPEQAIAMTLVSDTLTTEQVREAIEQHSAWVIGNNRCFHDGAYEEITNELNAMLSDENASL